MKTNRIKSLIVAGAALLLVSSCQEELHLPDTSPDVRPLTVQESKTVGSSNNFAFRAFAEISEEEENKNVFISPLSISMALAMAYNGSDAATRDAMRHTLGFTLPTDEEINLSFKSLSELLTNIDKDVKFTAANSLWHSEAVKLQAPFVQANKIYFDATMQGLEFASPAAKEKMNSWVKNKTDGKIEEIVQEVRHDHVLFLINAIYFKGAWTYKFKKELTHAAPFRLEDGSTVNHDFMNLKNGKYLYYQDDQKQVIDLPYGNRQFSMTLIVPQGQHTVEETIRKLNEEDLTAWMAAADTSTLDLYMPKFKLEYEKELKETLTQLGMGIAFDENADFSRMLEGQNKLAISEVKHKTFVEVNEEGTEAAAATSVGIVVTSLTPSIRIDRPFVFMIREKSSGAILFIGKLMQPE